MTSLEATHPRREAVRDQRTGHASLQRPTNEQEQENEYNLKGE